MLTIVVSTEAWNNSDTGKKVTLVYLTYILLDTL